jgi:hypothetical protein
VRTLSDLVRRAENFPSPVRQGVAERMVSARYNLGCALSKSGQRIAAVNAVLPAVLAQPGWQSLRSLLSMLRG